MAKKKQRTSRVSKGGRQKAHLNQEAKRQAKFAEKRENGEAYSYKPNPFKKGTVEYDEERLIRVEKSKSKKTDVAKMTSIMRKLDNFLEDEKKKAKNDIKRTNKGKGNRHKKEDTQVVEENV